MAIKPKLRPKDEEFSKIVASANSGGGGGDKPAAKGGKGGGKSVNPMAKKGSADFKTMQKANAPDSFYGYYDQNTGDYVPWYIDMINGGGANAAGPTFEGGFGTARLAGGLLNAAGISPYGQDRPRAFMPMEAYRGGDAVPFSQAPAAPAPTGVIDAVGGDKSTVTPVNPYAVGGGFDVTAPPVQKNPYSVGGGFDVTAPSQRLNPYGVGGGFDVTAPPSMVNPYGVGGGFDVTASPAPMPTVTSPMTIRDYLRSRGLEPSAANITRYMPDYVAAMGG